MKRFAAILLGAAALAALGAAQPSASPVWSLEVATDQSSFIGVGHVVDMKVNEYGEPMAAIAVDKVLKGESEKESIELRIWKPTDVLADLKRRKVSLLFFVREGRNVADPLYEIEDAEASAPLADFTFLKGGGSILKFVRERAEKFPGVRQDYFILPPLTAEKKAIWMEELLISGSAANMISGLAVPLDARVQNWAIGNLDSKDIQVVSRALSALPFFKSPEVIGIVRGLLRSPLYDASWDESNPGVEIRHYRIRRQAYEILKGWKVEVEPPVFDEKFEVYDQIKTHYWQGEASRERLRVLLKFKNLNELLFSGQKLGFAELSLISQVKTITVLRLNGAGFTNEGLEPLVSLPNLNSLDLSNTNITDAGLETIAAMESLRTVSVAGTEVTEAGLDALAKKRPDLRVLGSENLNPAFRYAVENNVEGLKRVASQDLQKLKAVDHWGSTPTHYAAQFAAYDALEFLLDQGSDVNAIDKEGKTPFLRAASPYRSDFRILQLLLERGADVDRPDAKGWTALQFRALHNNLYDVRYLLNSGADIGRLTPEFRESLHNLPEIAKLIEAVEAQSKNLPPMIPLIKGEARKDVYELTVGSKERLSTSELGPFTGPLEWSSTPTERPYLGPLGQQKVSLKLDDLPEHRLVTVEVEVFLIGSWDGNGDGEGPDILSIEVPGLGALLHSSFYNNGRKGSRMQSYPDVFRRGYHEGYTGAAEAQVLGFPDDSRDAVYRFAFTFAHAGSELQLDLKGLTVPQGGLGGLLYDERWGVSKLKVKTD